ncbi:GDYXXLXY domain-containing protein [Microbulbifer sp.]|uniref:GDYXXLXY domain-containing protein n=1 Tax=Microbulbifer sp. TaxID=1908541 RepID=UPI003F2BE92F
MKKKIVIGLIAAIAFQFVILTGMYVSAQMPLWTGTEVKLKTVPVDPRSLFRGNYARLEYTISRVDASLFPPGKRLRNGEVVYVSLEPGKNDLYELSGVSLQKPQSGLFLRGRVADRWFEGPGGSVRIKYGIEALFAPKEKALALEKELVDGGVAVVKVSGGGKARLQGVVAQ